MRRDFFRRDLVRPTALRKIFLTRLSRAYPLISPIVLLPWLTATKGIHRGLARPLVFFEFER